MEDVLRMGGQYDSQKYSRAAKVNTNTLSTQAHGSFVIDVAENLFFFFFSGFFLDKDYCSTKWSTLKQRLDKQLFAQQADIYRLKWVHVTKLTSSSQTRQLQHVTILWTIYETSSLSTKH